MPKLYVYKLFFISHPWKQEKYLNKVLDFSAENGCCEDDVRSRTGKHWSHAGYPGSKYKSCSWNRKEKIAISNWGVFFRGVVKVVSTFSVKMQQLWSTKQLLLGRRLPVTICHLFLHLWQWIQKITYGNSGLTMFLRVPMPFLSFKSRFCPN